MTADFSLTVSFDSDELEKFINEVPYVVEEALTNYFSKIDKDNEAMIICVEV